MDKNLKILKTIHYELAKHILDLIKSGEAKACLLYTSPSPRDRQKSRMPASA